MITVSSRQEVIAVMLMRGEYPDLTPEMSKYMSGDLPLPTAFEERVVDQIAAEKEINGIYEACKREGISESRLELVEAALSCPDSEKIEIMQLTFPIIACSESSALQELMVRQLARSLLLPQDAVTKDYKKWWSAHRKNKGFPIINAQNSLRDIITKHHNQ